MVVEDEEFIPDSYRLRVDNVDDSPPLNNNYEEFHSNPFLNTPLSPSNMYHQTGEAGNNVDIKTFNANSRSNLFLESKQVMNSKSQKKTKKEKFQ